MRNEQNVPLSVAFFCLIVWMLLSSLYFYLISHDASENQNWSYLEAFYFFFISVSTIGLGDYNVHDSSRTILDYVFIITGLAIFSFCIRLFLIKLQHIDDEVVKSIVDDYQSMLFEKYEALDSQHVSMHTDEEMQKIKIRQLIKEKGGFMRFFIAKQAEAKMLQEYQKRANMRLRATQTVVSVRTVCLDVKPNSIDLQTMAGDSYLNNGEELGRQDPILEAISVRGGHTGGPKRHRNSMGHRSMTRNGNRTIGGRLQRTQPKQQNARLEQWHYTKHVYE
jgi:hypothetical protein